MNRMMLRLLLLNLWWVSWVWSIAAAVLPSIITRTAVAAFSYSSQQHPQLPPYSIINTSRKDTTRSPGNAVDLEEAAGAAAEDNAEDDDNGEDPPLLTTPSPSSSPSPAPSKYWIVLVDDEESIRLAVGDYLFSSSQAAAAASSSEESASDHALLTYDVSAASDSTSLLQLIVSQQQQHAPAPSSSPAHDDDTHTSNGEKKKTKNQTYRLPDLIISDVRMPDSEKNGYELVEYIRSGGTTTTTTTATKNTKNNNNNANSRSNYIVDISQTTVPVEETGTRKGDDRVVHAVVAQLQNVPIILLTAKAMTEDRIRGYKAGADIIIPKPFAPQELLSCVNTILTQRQVRTDYYTKQHQQQQQQHEATDASSSSSSSLTNDATSAVQALRHEIDAIHAIVERTTKRGTTYVERTDVVLSDKERTFVACLAAGATMTEIIRQQQPSSPVSSPSTTSSTTITSKQKDDYTRVLQKLYDKTRTTTKTELLRWSRRVGYISET